MQDVEYKENPTASLRSLERVVRPGGVSVNVALMISDDDLVFCRNDDLSIGTILGVKVKVPLRRTGGVADAQRIGSDTMKLLGFRSQRFNGLRVRFWKGRIRYLLRVNRDQACVSRDSEGSHPGGSDNRGVL
jgi:hypothetical protein